MRNVEGQKRGNKMTDIQGKIKEIGIVPVIKLTNPEKDSVSLAKALIAGGVPVAEVTFRAKGADTAIRLMHETYPDMLVGAGTVLTKEQVDLAIEAGASFIVTPGLDVELVAYCQEKNIPIFPGCTTPTDYHAAYKCGLEVLKFFPAEQSGGLSKIKALSAPFPMFKIMPTGGVTLDNLSVYISNPTILACGGSYMVTADLIEGGKWDEITDLCKKSIEIIKKARA